MSASPEAIRETIEQYVALVASGTPDEIMALYAEGATVEDPVGSEVRTTRESIREFYAVLESMQQQGTVGHVRIAGSEAAFSFELVTKAGDTTVTLAPIDAMTFDDDAKITSMRAYWADSDMVFS